jgi:hypothetical protein
MSMGSNKFSSILRKRQENSKFVNNPLNFGVCAWRRIPMRCFAATLCV